MASESTGGTRFVVGRYGKGSSTLTGSQSNLTRPLGKGTLASPRVYLLHRCTTLVIHSVKLFVARSEFCAVERTTRSQSRSLYFSCLPSVVLGCAP